MESTRGILFYDKCRLCLDKPGVDNICETEDFPQEIYLCTGVKVSSKDNLPQKICAQCWEVINNAKELRLVATRNDSHLRSLFSNDDETDVALSEVTMSSSASETTKSSYKNDKSREISVHKRMKPSSKKRKTPSLDSVTQQPTTIIAVRKDLFKPSTSSTLVSSSTKVKSRDPKIIDSRRNKKIKSENEIAELGCEVCSKIFETRKKLFLHSRVHNKSIACPLDACGKVFATKGDLHKHIRAHTGEKPFVCDICDKSFTQQVTLRVHKETVHYSFSF